MAAKGLLPQSQRLASKTSQGVPLLATLVTGVVILLTFLLGGIDTVAPILTMFFLITYSAINLVVSIEQNL
jgi:amino acid transporter